MYGCPNDRENKQSGVERNKDRIRKESEREYALTFHIVCILMVGSMIPVGFHIHTLWNKQTKTKNTTRVIHR